MIGMADRKSYRSMWSLLVIVSLAWAGVVFPSGNKADAIGEFSPPLVRGFNTSAYGDLPRMKSVFKPNVVRLQLKPRTEALISGVSIAQGWQIQLDKMEGALQESAKQGMYVVIDLHDVPLSDPNLKTTSPEFWGDDTNKQVLVDSWTEIAQRFAPYRGNIWGYDLLNEPYNSAELPNAASKWPSWAQQIVNAIRIHDTVTPIIYEVSPGAIPRGFAQNFTLLNDSKVIYSFHMYQPESYTHQGRSTYNNAPFAESWPDQYTYPGPAGGTTFWDKNRLRQEFQPIIDFQARYGVPIYVGEFSAIRWAPGAGSYIRDCIELFEELGWSWTYHAYNEWHGWDVEYTDAMTSDANKDAAKALSPTDRELILKDYFNRNVFLPLQGVPPSPFNYVKNGGFERDADMDGLADYWGKGPQAETSLVKINDSTAQRVTMPMSSRGIDQEWISISDQYLYLLRAKIRVDKGKVRFWHYDVTSSYAYAGEGTAATVTDTGGAFVTKELKFVPPAGTARISVRLWADQSSDFMVDDVELSILGPK